jgi:acetyl-CoA synthetase
MIPIKEITDEAIEICSKNGFEVQNNIVLKFLDENIEIKWNKERDIWLGEELEKQSEYCEPVWLDSESPLFMLYTSGSTGTNFLTNIKER